MNLIPLVLLALVQTAPESAPGDVTVVGRVVEADGRPSAGAEVVLAEGVIPVSSAASRQVVRSFLPPAVLGRARADASGEVRLAMPARSSGEVSFLMPDRALWAVRPGRAVAVRAVPANWPPEGEPIRLELAEASDLTVRVVDPDGRPVAGAVVAPARVLGLPVPEEVAERLAATTGDDGRATLAGVSADDLDALRVVSSAFGTQRVRTPHADASGERVLTLAAAGVVTGRVVADDPEAVRGLTVRALTVLDPGDQETFGGAAEVRTDADGRFAIPAIAEGSLWLPPLAVRDGEYHGIWSRPGLPPVEAGQTTEVEAHLMRTIRVKGQVLERGTGRPVAGVLVRPHPLSNSPPARTDASGWFTAYTPVRVVAPIVVDAPAPYYSPRSRIDQQRIPPGDAESTLKPIELARGVTLRGRVVDEQGRPVPGAEVEGTWQKEDRSVVPVRSWSDRRGDFAIASVDPKAELRLSARHRGASTAEPRPAWADGEPVTLRLGAAHALALDGRAVDEEGRPIAGATVRILSRGTRAESRPALEGPVTFDGRPTLRTDADGRFRTPAWLLPDLEYRADVEADGLMPARTEWIAPATWKTTTFADLTLSPLARPRAVSGRVVDRAGRPVAGAIVSQDGDGPRRTRTTTDADGRFRLGGVCEGPAFLFVRGEGIPFQGRPIRASAEPVELTVRREGEPVRPTRKTLPPVLGRDEEKALARRVIAPLMPAFAAGDPPLLRVVAFVDPARALERVERGGFANARYNDYLRLDVAEGLADERPDEAAEVAEAIPTPHLRSQALGTIADALPAAERARKLGLLDRALRHARAEPEPADKLYELGRIAIRLIDLGEPDRAETILREGQAIAEGLPRPDPALRPPHATHARGAFAAKLARIDPEAALKLAEGFGDQPHDWYLGGVILGQCERDPAGAERLLGRINLPYRHDDVVARICGRTAAKDPERARRLARALADPDARAKALGTTAGALVNSDPSAAAELLDEAFQTLERHAEAGAVRNNYQRDACVLAASWLPIAERIGPEALDLAFWRALALRPVRPVRGDPTGRYEGTIGYFALPMARYDHAIARTILEPVARRARALINADVNTAQPFLDAAVEIDPAWAVALVDALPDEPPGAERRPKDAARLEVARALARGGPRHWDHILREFLFLDDNRDLER